MNFSILSAQIYSKSERYKMDVFVHLGYAKTFFTEPTQLNYYADLGTDFLFFDHFYITSFLSYQTFYKPNSENSPMKTFYTNMSGIDLGLMYEIVFNSNNSLFVGGSENVNLFQGHGIDKTDKYVTTGGYISRPVYNSRFFMRYRRPLSESVDLDLGVSYNVLQSHFADLYESSSSEKLDTYLNFTAGAVYYVGSSTLFKFKKRIKRTFCPRFKRRF